MHRFHHSRDHSYSSNIQTDTHTHTEKKRKRTRGGGACIVQWYGIGLTAAGTHTRLMLFYFLSHTESPDTHTWHSS